MTIPRPSARSKTAAEAPRPRLTADGLRLGECDEALFAGSVQYFRLERRHWRPALEQVRQLGLRIVETYAPWGVHERGEGEYDFGQRDARLDLRAFLTLAAELDLRVFLRPGPHVNAELSLFGLPERVVYDERNQARSARGNPLPLPAPPRFFPVPSYASRNFRRETRVWFEALGAQVADLCWPAGPLVLLQVDNEAAFYFRDGPYDADYHPDAIAAFRAFLEQRYGSIGKLNACWGTEHGSFAAVDAPRTARVRERSALPARFDWMEFQEVLTCDALAEMRRDLESSGFGALPMVHNLPMGEAGLPTSLAAIGRSVELVGLDYYHTRRGLDHVRRKTLRLAGATALPFAPELGVGAPPWFGGRDDADAMFTAMAACAFGLRAFSLYMAVGRDRWYGAPIAPDGTPRASAERWQRLLRALRESELHTLRRRTQVAISLPREYARLMRATHALGAISPSALNVAGLPPSSACRTDTFGFEEPIQTAWIKLLWRLDRALCELQIPFVYVEAEADLPDATLLPDLKLLFAPTYEFASVERMETLARFERAGGTVVWGPRWPTLDASLRPHEFERIGQQEPLQLVDQPSTEERVRALADALELERPFPVFPRPVLSAVHGDERGPRVVFLVNPGPADARAEVQLPHALAATDAMSDETFEGEVWRIPMAAFSCRMLRIADHASAAPKTKRRGPSARAGSGR